jgi:hypothetical protein
MRFSWSLKNAKPTENSADTLAGCYCWGAVALFEAKKSPHEAGFET